MMRQRGNATKRLSKLLTCPRFFIDPVRQGPERLADSMFFLIPSATNFFC